MAFARDAVRETGRPASQQRSSSLYRNPRTNGVYGTERGQNRRAIRKGVWANHGAGWMGLLRRCSLFHAGEFSCSRIRRPRDNHHTRQDSKKFKGT